MTSLQIIDKHGLDSELDQCKPDWLCEIEAFRFRSITNANRRQQYLAGHYLVRKMASRSYGNSIADWRYFEDSNGLRRLGCDRADVPVPYLSISHSGDWIAGSISLSPIGIDIECLDKERDFIAIAEHVFSAPEVEMLRAGKASELKMNFYRHWTLKECLAKQYGLGLKFEVSRVHSAISEPTLDASQMQSWECPDFVISAACDSRAPLEIIGLCDEARHQTWRNIPLT